MFRGWVTSGFESVTPVPLKLRTAACSVLSYILPVRRQRCALVRGGGGVTTSQTSWPRGAAAGRERHFSANWRHRSPPAPDSSPRYTNTGNRRSTRHSRPAGRRPAASRPAWGAGLAPHPGSGRCRRCRPRWPAGRTPGCGGTRPPSLCSGWTRCCRSGKTWNGTEFPCQMITDWFLRWSTLW